MTDYHTVPEAIAHARAHIMNDINNEETLEVYNETLQLFISFTNEVKRLYESKIVVTRQPDELIALLRHIQMHLGSASINIEEMLG